MGPKVKNLQGANIQIEHINVVIRDSYMDKESLMPIAVFEMSFSRFFWIKDVHFKMWFDRAYKDATLIEIVSTNYYVVLFCCSELMLELKNLLVSATCRAITKFFPVGE